MVLVMCIYAILGVDLFGRFAEDGSYVNIEGEEVRLMTSRGLTYGNEYYGTFGRSLYTLFQVLTGDSWSEAVARPPIFLYFDSPVDQTCTSLFFVSFILLNAIV